MLSENIQENIKNDVEFLFERPIGWSSTCLDSTINYYLHCNYENMHVEDETDEQQCKS